jgi:DUF971 family protein
MTGMQRNGEPTMAAVENDPWPTELRVTDQGRRLRVAYEDGATFDLAAEYLRVESPSAEVQGHAPAERKIVPGKRDVRIVAATPVGNYAVKLAFDDGHDSGLFTWTYLYRLGREHSVLWAAYLAALAEKGLSR